MKTTLPLSLLALPFLTTALLIPPTSPSFSTNTLPQSPLDLSEAQIASALSDPFLQTRRLIQTSPTESRWVTESEKLDLKRQGVNFIDITDHRDLGVLSKKKRDYTFPDAPKFQKTIQPLLERLREENMRANLEEFTGFHTRYFRSDYGRQSSEWLFSRINQTANGLEGLELTPFPHSWPQSSIIARIPGRTSKTVVIGAHQDSINLFFPSLLAAPGADDDGSGTVTILEAFRVLCEAVKAGDVKLENTVEFHWYSAEEGGLLGSQAIFSAYEREGRDVRAMLQQDMTGFIQKTLDAGKPESVGVITDYVSAPLTDFIKKIISEYCAIPYVETLCGYACSDHASASKAGYPSAFVIESAFDDSDDKIHTTDDKLKYLSFSHMREHGKLTLGLAVELGMTKVWDEDKKEAVEKGGEL